MKTNQTKNQKTKNQKRLEFLKDEWDRLSLWSTDEVKMDKIEMEMERLEMDIKIQTILEV